MAWVWAPAWCLGLQHHIGTALLALPFSAWCFNPQAGSRMTATVPVIPSGLEDLQSWHWGYLTLWGKNISEKVPQQTYPVSYYLHLDPMPAFNKSLARGHHIWQCKARFTPELRTPLSTCGSNILRQDSHLLMYMSCMISYLCLCLKPVNMIGYSFPWWDCVLWQTMVE